MLAEFCGVLADFGRADQQLKRTAEPASSAGGDQIVNAPLRGCHLRWHDLAISGHVPSYLLKAVATTACGSRDADPGRRRLQRINAGESRLSPRKPNCPTIRSRSLLLVAGGSIP